MNKEVKSYMRDMYVDDIFCENGEIWFVGINNSILYRIDANNEIYPIKMIPYRKEICFRNSSVCYKKKKNIYCFPERGQIIYIFDIEKNTIKEIQLENKEQRLGIYNVWFIDGNILCVSFQNNKLYIINEENQKIKKIQIPYLNFPKLDIQATCYEKKLYFVSNKSTTVLEFSVEDMKFIEHYIKCKEKGFSTIAVDGEEIFITGRECALYRYNLLSNKLDSVDLKTYMKFEKKDVMYTGNIFYRSILLDGYVVLITENIFQLINNQIVIFNIRRKTINVLTFDDNNERKPGEFFVISKYSDSEIIIYDNWNRAMFLYNLDMQSLEEKDIKVGKTIAASFANDLKSIINYKEDRITDLRKYLQALNM